MCKEVATTRDIRWRKSTYTNGGGDAQCVELAHTRDSIRDSKNPTGPVLSGDLSALLAAVKADQLG